MDPITTTLIAALIAGAVAGTRDIATQAIRDAYSAFKHLLVDCYPSATEQVKAVVDDPFAPEGQHALAKALVQSPPPQELREAAVKLIRSVHQLENDPNAQALFDFSKLRAAGNFTLEDIFLHGPLLRAEEANFDGDFVAKGVRQASRGTEKN